MRKQYYISLVALAVIAMSCGGPSGGPSREKAIQNAIDQVKETMQVALPDVAHPEPYKYGGSGDCALVPGWNSSKETLLYQVKVPLPEGDDGLVRQAKAIRHWVDKGATIRTLPYDKDRPPNEVNYKGGSIMVFAMATRNRKNEQMGSTNFYIGATTPCIPKID